MSRTTDALARAHTDIDQALKPVTVDSRSRRAARVTLAAAHLDDWQAAHPPPAEERGGSSASTELADRKTERSLADRIAEDQRLLPELVRRIEVDCRALAGLVAHYADSTSEMPTEVAGCQSCARVSERKGSRLGGHWAPIRESAQVHRLCDWCYRHALAQAADRAGSIVRQDWPPIKACDLFHGQGAQAAGRWLARQPASAFR